MTIPLLRPLSLSPQGGCYRGILLYLYLFYTFDSLATY